MEEMNVKEERHKRCGGGFFTSRKFDKVDGNLEVEFCVSLERKF
jgi:hypothetical protein